MIELAAFSICETRILLYYAMNVWFVVVFSILFNDCIQGGIVQPPAFCSQNVNHSVSIDLSNENVASTVLSFYRYPMQLLRTSAP